MEEYYRKKLLKSIKEDGAEDYDILKTAFKNVKIIKFDRCNNIIDFPLWLLLIRNSSYTNVQIDILENYKVISQWVGDIENPFELVISQEGNPLYIRSFVQEDSLLKFHEKVVFVIEQKMPFTTCIY